MEESNIVLFAAAILRALHCKASDDEALFRSCARTFPVIHFDQKDAEKPMLACMCVTLSD